MEEQGTLDPSANIKVSGENLTKVTGDEVTVVITEAGEAGTTHTHTLEILESGPSYMTLKMPTEVASYNMPTSVTSRSSCMAALRVRQYRP